MTQKTNLLLFLLFLVCFHTNAQSKEKAFKPILRVVSNVNIHNDRSTIHSGIFEIDNSAVNFGAELTHRFNISENYFIESGLKYQYFKTIVNAINTFQEIHTNPHPFEWENRYSAISIPIYLGRNLRINNQNRGDVYLGFSLGILSTTYASVKASMPLLKDPDDFSTIHQNLWGKPNPTPSYFYPTFNLGMNFMPIKELPKLTIGVGASAQLISTKMNDFSAEQINMSNNNYQLYDMTLQKTLFNLSFTVGYRF